MLLLSSLRILINIHTVNIIWHNLIVIRHIISIEPGKLAHLALLCIFLTNLSEVYDFVSSFGTTGGVSVVFERYLVLGHVDSTVAIATGVRVSSCSLTAQLLFIMKARIS